MKNLFYKARKVTAPNLVLCVLVSLFPSTLAHAECAKSLKEACERLEQQSGAETFQQAVNDCQDVTDGNCRHLLDEEDSLLLERFYHSYADSLQRLAAKMENSEYKIHLNTKALERWEQYFEWLRNLPEQERNRLMTSPGTRKGKKIWAAAAAIGISALAAKKPESAWSDYELLEADYFGTDAVNWWLASLFYPGQPDYINDSIFAKTAENPQKIKTRCAEPGWKKHWFAFAQRVRELIASERFGSFREIYIQRIDQIVRSTGNESEETFTP
jgi:hypothetical protein